MSATERTSPDPRCFSRCLPRLRWIGLAAICAVTLGCDDEPPAVVVHVAPPTHDKQLLAQPQLNFAGGKVTQQGTAFFVRAPNGETAAVTASHYLNQDGPALEHVWLLNVSAEKPTPLADSTVSWGPPGGIGARGPNDLTDLQTDRFLLPVSVDDKIVHVLDLDDRAFPNSRERVWFPDKQPSEPGGFRLIEGTVTKIDARFFIVRLDSAIKPQSQSGSPVISQVNGRALGLWAGVTQSKGTTFLYLNPAREIRRALEDTSRPSLSAVVGKATADDRQE
ncbi:MAG: hypothetical protein HY290_03785 [Planctomycetia bacterium]|nr:hypothetical protein [Planctomycetia bacterium]